MRRNIVELVSTLLELKEAYKTIFRSLALTIKIIVAAMICITKELTFYIP